MAPEQNESLLLLLGRMDGKLDAALGRLEKHEDTIAKLDEDLDALKTSRVRDRAYATGFAAALVGGFAWMKEHLF